MTPERRYAECRALGRVLLGTAMPYGEVATLPWGRERFEPRAFSGAGADIVLNIQHDRGRAIARSGVGLTLTDSDQALKIRAELPPGPAQDEALANVRAGILRGFSVEFRSIRERAEGDLRIVERAQLLDVALVDRPVYGGAEVEARARDAGAAPDDWLRAAFRRVHQPDPDDGPPPAARPRVWVP